MMLVRLFVIGIIFVTNLVTASVSDKITLGGLFPVSNRGEGDIDCGSINNVGLQRLEGMLFALDLINADTKLLPGITLGARLYDTCRRETYALEQTIEMISQDLQQDSSMYVCPNGSAVRRADDQSGQSVTGVVGAASSSISQPVASILRLFQIPQISYASTSPELSDKMRFDYFLRVVPPDTFQSQAMFDIIKFMGWTYVSTVAEAGEYGENGIDAFINLTRNTGICISRSEVIERGATEAVYSRIVSYLAEDKKARVVVIFAQDDQIKGLLKASNNLTERFLWVASDGWGTKESIVESGMVNSAVDAITVRPERFDVEGFNDYFLSLNPLNNSRNKWFKSFWEEQHSCSFDVPGGSNNVTSCKDVTSIFTRENFVQEDKVAFVVDSVYAFAYALQNMSNNENTGTLVENALNGEMLLKYIKQVEFIGKGTKTVSFNKDGDRLGRYHIFQYQKRGSTYTYHQIGEWKDQHLVLNTSEMAWNDGSEPVSECSEPCRHGQIKKIQGGSQCCWVCTECTEYAYKANELSCTECQQGYRPDANRTECIQITAEFATWGNPGVLISIIVASAGLTFTGIVIAIFLRFNDTPIIRASGRELTYVLLTGIAYCYALPFIILAPPTNINCGVLRCSLGLSSVICYAAILTKTNRIARIFNNCLHTVKRPKFAGPSAQLVICGCLVSVQVFLVTIWLLIDPPAAVEQYPTRDKVVLRCQVTDKMLLVSNCYSFLLIIFCTIYAFKTRKIPENFNEAKFIAFAMYASCILWIAFIPIYLGTSVIDYKIQDMMMSLAVMLSATSLLCCLFGPKVYIVLLQPEKNTRTLGRPGTTKARSFSADATASIGPTLNNGTSQLSIICGQDASQIAARA
ncbi:metabotropic glutamate receptor 3-like [Anneissia japonica]|uniref:metabotropic glutamate receptor 3-like n=1 Tax=Anneissia japonica TaxID=1529436 RepID=UPI001425A0E3|nr:metabotropic glutamate receptor 3-like [Anneissia japonica]